VIGSLLKLGAVNVTDALALPAVAVPIVGAVEGPLVEPADELRIGMYLFYLTLLHVIVGRG
jgi:hypothetical protein